MADDDYPSLFRKLIIDNIRTHTESQVGSEEMSFVQFIIPLEVAHDTIAELGQLGDVQFKDVSLIIFIIKKWALNNTVVESQYKSFPAVVRERDSARRRDGQKDSFLLEPDRKGDSED
jgi:hypothetical protein